MACASHGPRRVPPGGAVDSSLIRDTVPASSQMAQQDYVVNTHAVHTCAPRTSGHFTTAAERASQPPLEALAELDRKAWFDPTLWRSVCGGPISSANIARCVRKLAVHSPLTAAQRVLLTTDGSVTLALEALTGRPIRIAVLSQSSAAVGPGYAGDGELALGSAVSRRFVALCDEDRILCLGSTVLRWDRLPPKVVARLQNTNIALGRLIFRPRVGVKRCPASVDIVTAPDSLAHLFSAAERLLVRHSHLVLKGETIGSLREWFFESHSRFDSGSPLE